MFEAGNIIKHKNNKDVAFKIILNLTKGEYDDSIKLYGNWLNTVYDNMNLGIYEQITISKDNKENWELYDK